MELVLSHFNTQSVLFAGTLNAASVDSHIYAQIHRYTITNYQKLIHINRVNILQADPSCVDPENPSGSFANLSDIQTNNASLPSLELQYASNSTLSSFGSSDHVSSDGNSKPQN